MREDRGKRITPVPQKPIELTYCDAYIWGPFTIRRMNTRTSVRPTATALARPVAHYYLRFPSGRTGWLSP